MITPDLLAWAGLCAASIIIGIMVGATGIGGFLIIPVLVQLADLPIRSAMGCALVIAAANGAMGAWLFRRRGKVEWAVARPLVWPFSRPARAAIRTSRPVAPAPSTGSSAGGFNADPMGSGTLRSPVRPRRRDHHGGRLWGAAADRANGKFFVQPIDFFDNDLVRTAPARGGFSPVKAAAASSAAMVIVEVGSSR